MWNEILTGNKRYRVTIFKKLVLQVEYVLAESYIEAWNVKLWRDARVEDITNVN